MNILTSTSSHPNLEFKWSRCVCATK